MVHSIASMVKCTIVCITLQEVVSPAGRLQDTKQLFLIYAEWSNTVLHDLGHSIYLKKIPNFWWGRNVVKSHMSRHCIAQNWAELKTKRVSNCRQNFFQVPAKTFRFPVQLVRGDLVTSGTLVPLGVIITDNPLISSYRACLYRIK